jgi:hypothetical protein
MSGRPSTALDSLLAGPRLGDGMQREELGDRPGAPPEFLAKVGAAVPATVYRSCPPCEAAAGFAGSADAAGVDAKADWPDVSVLPMRPA